MKRIKKEPIESGKCSEGPSLWCARLDSNQRPSGSEFPDGQQKMAVSSHLSSLVHKRCGNTKSPRSLLNTGSAGFCTHGGQIVVKISGGVERRVERFQIAKTNVRQKCIYLYGIAGIFNFEGQALGHRDKKAI